MLASGEAGLTYQDSYMELNTYRGILSEVTGVYLNHFHVGERALNLDFCSTAAKKEPSNPEQGIIAFIYEAGILYLPLQAFVRTS